MNISTKQSSFSSGRFQTMQAKSIEIYPKKTKKKTTLLSLVRTFVLFLIFQAEMLADLSYVI